MYLIIIKKKMIKSPEVITIFLNRREFDVEFEYPLVINIDKYNTSKNNDYELICVLTHIGPSGMAGHFIAICKSRIDKKWYLFNDQTVTKSSYKDALNKGTPYILFYHVKI